MAWIGGNRWLSKEEMQENAKMIHSYFISKGWTLNAICGMLGNMQSESSINPQIWQGLDEGNLVDGYGLVQWTPATKYIDWAGTDYGNGDRQCDRIIYELENGLQWGATTAFPLSFQEFSISTDTPYNLGMAFIANYERPLDGNQPWRGEQANEWYTFLSGVIPPNPSKKKKMPLYMYLKKY